ncbi:MAG: hypothetical protein HOP23_05125 [Methylococcaceae bacterium]|nr:hypothetical protein [Methylococcaceae bacterium]
MKSRTSFLGVCCLLLVTACATPSKQFAKVAINSGFADFSINTGHFTHQLYINERARHPSPAGVVHVYLDGDGTPWEQQRWISDDPTSRNPIILELMRQDNKPSLLLGRPCYHGFNKETACHHKYWTSHRYAKEIVSSMVIALKRWVTLHPCQHIVLIGFSGGGALAVLMANLDPNIQSVVTVAANLDTNAWATYHHYQALSGSLNPAKLTLNTQLQQIHLAGLKDKVVPASLIKGFADKQVNVRYIAYPHFDHHCCWVKEWPTILSLF